MPNCPQAVQTFYAVNRIGAIANMIHPLSAEKEIEMYAKAIEQCGRPIVLSLSPGPAVIEKAHHYKTFANMWRITDDFWDDWKLLKAMFERCEVWQSHVGNGNWPDCDMLPMNVLGYGWGKIGDKNNKGWMSKFTPEGNLRSKSTVYNRKLVVWVKGVVPMAKYSMPPDL